MTESSFSYAEYLQILNAYDRRFVNFHEATENAFAILRHDVEFSVDRALKLALLEAEHNTKSTFFFQVLSNAYNPFSVKNYKKIQKIEELGHDVGLHFYITHLNHHDHGQLRSELARQKAMFELGLDMECKAFSFHRPPKWVLEIREDVVDGILNAYGPSYFEFSPNPEKIKYITDSQHKWSYGHPLDFSSESKVQILLHPDEWSPSGDTGPEGFFSSIIDENANEFISTLDGETKHFAAYKMDLK